MTDDIPATIPHRGNGEAPRSRGVIGLLAARWTQIAEPFRETDFEQQEPWFDPTQFDSPLPNA
ncbi:MULTISPECIES: hypothetical protein [Ramlibacter]|uniref:Uncharacterized protein n=1 Tax=Ramlibacter pinisoli TaxID=2682844 RepID=A0A6N8IY39_9BURK|nr:MULTISPECIES: hypothetical protein [Ramlibacter]MBA2960967.1 hypothetical protein [Ramlibacter sp. CGMCC 1.13660]MVQ30913.1 hypothetical protein [Ramlibacter pinisoli]